ACRPTCPWSLQVVQNLINLFGREIFVIDVIDHHHRRAGAGGQAFLFALEEDAAVGRALAEADAEFLLDVGDDIVRAIEHARDVRAHADMVAAAGARLEHRIEGGHLIHMDGGQIQVFGHRVHQVGREKTVVLLLREAQRREHRRALAAFGESRHPLIDLVAGVLAEQRRLATGLGAHRSTSPNTMSWVPITATTSASMWPSTISASADRCAKPGARQCNRYGLLAPSETRYTPNSPFRVSTAP